MALDTAFRPDFCNFLNRSLHQRDNISKWNEPRHREFGNFFASNSYSYLSSLQNYNDNFSPQTFMTIFYVLLSKSLEELLERAINMADRKQRRTDLHISLGNLQRRLDIRRSYFRPPKLRCYMCKYGNYFRREWGQSSGVVIFSLTRLSPSKSMNVCLVPRLAGKVTLLFPRKKPAKTFRNVHEAQRSILSEHRRSHLSTQRTKGFLPIVGTWILCMWEWSRWCR